MSAKQKAEEYRRRGLPRFKARHKCTSKEECEFCNGWSWGAIDGYMAGYRAAKKERENGK